MGFYDVKNAKLLDRREDESIVQREPLVDMDQFGNFFAVADVLMQPKQGFGLDLAWEVRQRFPQNQEEDHGVRMERKCSSSCLLKGPHPEVVCEMNAGYGKRQDL